MNLPQCKFIVYDDKLIMGRVLLHKHLLPDNFDMSKIYGGGLFMLNKEDQSITFYGKSYDFGYFNKDDITVDKLPERFRDYSIRFI